MEHQHPQLCCPPTRHRHKHNLANSNILSVEGLVETVPRVHAKVCVPVRGSEPSPLLTMCPMLALLIKHGLRQIITPATPGFPLHHRTLQLRTCQCLTSGPGGPWGGQSPAPHCRHASAPLPRGPQEFAATGAWSRACSCCHPRHAIPPAPALKAARPAHPSARRTSRRSSLWSCLSSPAAAARSSSLASWTSGLPWSGGGPRSWPSATATTSSRSVRARLWSNGRSVQGCWHGVAFGSMRCGRHEPGPCASREPLSVACTAPLDGTPRPHGLCLCVTHTATTSQNKADTHTRTRTHTHTPVLGPLTHAGGQRRRWLPRAPPHGLVLPLLHQQQRGARRCAWARHQTPWDITLVPSCAHPPHLCQQQRGARRRMRPLQAPAPLPPSLPAAATAHCCASRAIGSPCLPPLRLSRSPCTRVLLLPGGRVVVTPPRPHL